MTPRAQCRHWFFDAWFWLGPDDSYCIKCWAVMSECFEDDLQADWHQIAEQINVLPEG
jgi:hypothetical protein